MQNSIETRGNLCTKLGLPVLVDVLYWCLEVFLSSRKQGKKNTLYDAIVFIYQMFWNCYFVSGCG